MAANSDLEQSQNEVVQENNSSETAGGDCQLHEEIGQLDEALDDLAADWQTLRARKDDMEQRIQALDKEIKKHQKILRRAKCSRVMSVLLCIAVTIVLLGIGFSLAVKKINMERDAQSLAYGVQLSALDEELDALRRQRDSLKKEIVAVQSGKVDTESTVLTEQNRKELEDYIVSLNRHPFKRVEQKTYNGVSCYEVVQRYDLGGYLLNDAGNATVYPGAILRGDSLMQGTTSYSLLAQNRMPMTLTCSRGGNSIRLEDMSYGAVTQAVAQLWAESNSGYSQKWEYTVHSARNEEGLKLSLGIEASNASFGLGASRTDTTSTMAINFTETYFTIVAEPLSSATQYFQDGYDLKNLGDYEPAYVSSVDYGRRLVVLVTTEMSEDELNAKLGANIKGVNISADIGYIRKNIDSGCRIYVYGGDSAQNLQLMDSDKQGGLRGWWNSLLNGESDSMDDINGVIAGDDSMVNPVPLTYHLSYLSDNSAVPAVAILDDNIILAENAKLVTLTLEGGKNSVPGVFRLDDSVNSIGYVVNENQIRINKEGNTSGEIQFIWDSSHSASLTGYFNDKHCAYPLTTYPVEEEQVQILERKEGFFSTKQTDIHIYISDVVYEIQ